MARLRHLNRAPITEALIDIRVERKADLTFAELQNLFKSPDFGYYFKNAISQGTFGFRLTSDGQQPRTTATAEQVGVRLHSPDEKYVAQCQLNGFTLSRLPPYEDWTALVAETRRIWSVYCDLLSPVRVTRVATRFINNLRLPLEPGASFQTYLEKFADVPAEAPQAMASFFQSFRLIDMVRQATVNLTIALESTPPVAPAPVIMDVEAFASRDLRPEDGELWAILESLRDIKNQCFFGSLTETAAELYE